MNSEVNDRYSCSIVEHQNNDSIGLINRYGTIKASRGDAIPGELVRLFNQFVEFLRADPSQSPSENLQSALGGLYLAVYDNMRQNGLLGALDQQRPRS